MEKNQAQDEASQLACALVDDFYTFHPDYFEQAWLWVLTCLDIDNVQRTVNIRMSTGEAVSVFPWTMQLTRVFYAGYGDGWYDQAFQASWVLIHQRYVAMGELPHLTADQHEALLKWLLNEAFKACVIVTDGVCSTADSVLAHNAQLRNICEMLGSNSHRMAIH